MIAALACAAALAIDGDTLRCPGGPALRLARIDAPERERSLRCRRPRPDVTCDDARAAAATRHLRRLLGRGALACELVDATPRQAGFQSTDRYGRPVVRCTVAGVDLGEALLRAGHAVRW